MRSYKTLLQRYLKIRLRSYRFTRELTQEQMAELLHISPRAYYDLENGKYGFSALTLVFFLSALPADRGSRAAAGISPEGGQRQAKQRHLTAGKNDRAPPKRRSVALSHAIGRLR